MFKSQLISQYYIDNIPLYKDVLLNINALQFENTHNLLASFVDLSKIKLNNAATICDEKDDLFIFYNMCHFLESVINFVL